MTGRRPFLRGMALGIAGTAVRSLGTPVGVVAAIAPRVARALGRVPLGRTLTLSLPWPLATLDPHDLFDPAAALFASAIVDPLFALDAAGAPYPTLAAELPTMAAGRVTVRLRPGMISAAGRPIDARDAVESIARARRAGASAWLGDLPAPVVDRGDLLALSFAAGGPTPVGAGSTLSADHVARLLASPLVALVPRGFRPDRPDGTGAFRAELKSGALVLSRNPRAARGASFVDSVSVTQAPSLSEALRAFESGSANIGWLGAGLHTPRAEAVAFDAGAVAWIVLRTGREAGAWGAPGTAQQLADSLPAERLQHLGIGVASGAGANSLWRGPAGDLWVRADAPQLVEIARTIAGILSTDGHAIAAHPAPLDEIARRRASNGFLMMLDVVRPLAPFGLGALLSLATAADPSAARDLARLPPRLASDKPRELTRNWRLGVVGELRINGALAPEVRLGRAPFGEGWDLGSSYCVGAPGSSP